MLDIMFEHAMSEAHTDRAYRKTCELILRNSLRCERREARFYRCNRCRPRTGHIYHTQISVTLFRLRFDRWKYAITRKVLIQREGFGCLLLPVSRTV